MKGCLNNILFFIVSFNIQAFCGTYATEPFIFIFLESGLFNTSKLFNIAFNKHVFPAPIGPTIPIKSPLSIFNFISFNNSIISISGIFSSFLDSFTSNLISCSFSSFISFLFISSSFDNNCIFLSSFSFSYIFNSKSFNSISFSSLLILLTLFFLIFFLLLISLDSLSSFSLISYSNSSSAFWNSSRFFIIPKSNPSISIANFSFGFGFVFLTNSFGLYSFLFKKTSILLKESKESTNPFIYSGRRKRGSANE